MMNDDAKKGLVYSIIFHIICLALVGALALCNFHNVDPEPIYDVALMGGSDEDIGEDQPEQQEEEVEEEEEEEIVPEPDDIVEEKEVKEVKPKQVVKTKKTVKTHSKGGGGGGGKGTGTGKGIGSGNADEGIQKPAVAPRVTRSGRVVYPDSARRAGIEGTPVIRFLVGKAGNVEDFSLVRSSGSNDLDRAAMNAAAGFRFSPGMDQYGRPIRCYAYQGITFRLR